MILFHVVLLFLQNNDVTRWAFRAKRLFFVYQKLGESCLPIVSFRNQTKRCSELLIFGKTPG